MDKCKICGQSTVGLSIVFCSRRCLNLSRLPDAIKALHHEVVFTRLARISKSYAPKQQA